MIEQTLGKIAEYGILGLFFVLLCGVVFYLYKGKEVVQEKRFEDLKEIRKDDVAFRVELKVLLQNILDILRGGQK